MRYLMRRREHKGSQMSRTRCCCAYCGASSEHEMVSCIVTVQNGCDEETCLVKHAEYPPQGNCKSVIEALIMTNNVRHEHPNPPTRLETSVGSMWACKVAPWITLQVSGKNKLVGTEKSIRRSLGPTSSPTLWLQKCLFHLRQGLGGRA